MSILDYFILFYSVQPGYAIKAKARPGYPHQWMDHWLIYMGKMNFPDANGHLRNQHVFALNMLDGGTQFIGEQQAMQLLEQYYPTEVQACYLNQPCNPALTWQRAFEIVQYDPRKYNLLTYNCQHFVNEVTTGKAESYQAEAVVKGVAIGVGVFAIGAFIASLFDD